MTQCVTLKLHSSNQSWFFSNVYASLIPTFHSLLWGHLVSMSTRLKKTWLLSGDFNKIAFPLKNIRGLFHTYGASTFTNMMVDYNLFNSGSV
jgi:hypothetical protein